MIGQATALPDEATVRRRMGLLKMRKRKIAQSAADLLEPGETIEQMVMTQTGMSAASLAAATASDDHVGPTGGVAVHALVATDRNLYVLWIPAWTAVGGVRSKQPLRETTITRKGNKLSLDGEVYNVLFFAGGDAKRLVSYIEAFEAQTPSRPLARTA
jgi:hypothetical protein